MFSLYQTEQQVRDSSKAQFFFISISLMVSLYLLEVFSGKPLQPLNENSKTQRQSVYINAMLIVFTFISS